MQSIEFYGFFRYGFAIWNAISHFTLYFALNRAGVRVVNLMATSRKKKQNVQTRKVLDGNKIPSIDDPSGVRVHVCGQN